MQYFGYLAFAFPSVFLGFFLTLLLIKYGYKKSTSRSRKWIAFILSLIVSPISIIFFGGGGDSSVWAPLISTFCITALVAGPSSRNIKNISSSPNAD
jgi:hypothetical protein